MIRLILILLALIINSLLGFIGLIAFFHLFPESLEFLSPMEFSFYALLGFVLFLLIEGYFHWHQCKKCDIHPFSYVMLIGDGIHNFIDGLIIAASFFISISLGAITTLMIILHEAPQELGLFGSLVYSGHNKNKSLFYSFIAQSTCILGGLIGYFLSFTINIVSPFLISFAAGGFIYISASDLIPEIHKAYKGDVKKSLCLIGFLFLGIILMYGIKFIGS